MQCRASGLGHVATSEAMAATLRLNPCDDVMGGKAVVHNWVDSGWPVSSGDEGYAQHGLLVIVSASGGGDGAVVAGVQVDRRGRLGDVLHYCGSAPRIACVCARRTVGESRAPILSEPAMVTSSDVITLLKVSWMHISRLPPHGLGKTLDLGLLDRTMVTLSVPLTL
jgi:hypothetical protein